MKTIYIFTDKITRIEIEDYNDFKSVKIHFIEDMLNLNFETQEEVDNFINDLIIAKMSSKIFKYTYDEKENNELPF